MEVGHALSGSSSTWFLVELEFGSVGFWGEGKTGVPGEKPLTAKEGTNTGLSKVAGCRQKLPPAWLVLASYSAWLFVTDKVF